jgi:tetratricopeptide (TPR) repeat protein|tara:strand:+ start:4104 stop:5105 length:1002 start_codon:yes stop_codon:yes gene_type:complete
LKGVQIERLFYCAMMNRLDYKFFEICMLFRRLQNFTVSPLKTFNIVIVFFLIGCSDRTDIDKVNQFYSEGSEFLEKGKIDSALYSFKSVLKIDSNHLLAINSLAEIHFRKIEIGKALHLFEKSALLDSTNAQIHLKIAEIKLFIGDYKEVFKNINKGLRLNDQLSHGYFMKGVAYKHIGDTVKAVSSLKTAVELNDKLTAVYYELGLILTLKKDSSAIFYYKNGLEIDPVNLDLLYSLAWSYSEFGKLKEAEGVYQELLTLDKNYSSAKFNWAVIKFNKLEYDSCLILLNELLVAEPLNEEVLNVKGNTLEHLGLYDEAKAVAEQLISLKKKK